MVEDCNLEKDGVGRGGDRYFALLLEKVKELLGDETSHGIDHALRTCDLACKISLAEGGDIDVIRAAALLHDIGRENIFSDPGHGKRGAGIAREILVRIGADWDLEKITDIIARHDDPDDGDYLELEIVKDADKLELMRISPDYLELDRLSTDEALRLVPQVIEIHCCDGRRELKAVKRTVEMAERLLRERRVSRGG